MNQQDVIILKMFHLLSKPSLTECESMFTQTKKVTVHQHNIIQESETSIIPFDFNKAESCSPTSTSKSPGAPASEKNSNEK